MTQLWPCHRRFQEPSFRDWSDFAKCLGPWDGGPCTVQDSLNWVLFVRNFEVRERETCNHIVSYPISSNWLQLEKQSLWWFVMEIGILLGSCEARIGLDGPADSSLICNTASEATLTQVMLPQTFVEGSMVVVCLPIPPTSQGSWMTAQEALFTTWGGDDELGS